MAFPGSGGLVQDNLDDAWSAARNLAREMKLIAQSVRANSLAGTVRSGEVFQLTTFIADAKDRLNITKNMSGMSVYAQEQVGDLGLNITTEFNSMISAMDGVVSAVSSIFPKDANGFLLGWTLSVAGRLVDRTFNAASTTNLRTALDVLIATIS